MRTAKALRRVGEAQGQWRLDCLTAGRCIHSRSHSFIHSFIHHAHSRRAVAQHRLGARHLWGRGCNGEKARSQWSDVDTPSPQTRGSAAGCVCARPGRPLQGVRAEACTPGAGPELDWRRSCVCETPAGPFCLPAPKKHCSFVQALNEVTSPSATERHLLPLPPACPQEKANGSSREEITRGKDTNCQSARSTRVCSGTCGADPSWF